MQAAQVLASEFVEVAIVESRALPTHAADQAKCPHQLTFARHDPCRALNETAPRYFINAVEKG
jgi:hypothetical protein